MINFILWSFYIQIERKGRDLTQSYGKRPLQKIPKKQSDNTKTPTKYSDLVKKGKKCTTYVHNFDVNKITKGHEDLW